MRSILLLFAAIGVAAVTAHAQQTTSTTREARVDDEEEVITLSPFEATTSTDEKSYFLKDTLGGTRIRSELRDLGASITVIGKDFLNDTLSTDNEGLLVYAMSTEVAGSRGNFLGNGDGAVVSGVAQINTGTRVRGLTSADNTRGYFITDIPWDSYNTGRIDLQRGPNSVLFGLGSPGGIVNATVEGATFQDSYELGNRLDEYGTVRWSGTINKVLIKDELAVRLSGLRFQEKFKQDPAYKDDNRLYGAIRWEPRFLKKTGMRSVFKANYETGQIKATLPNLTPPGDFVSAYFREAEFRDANGNLRVFNPLTTDTVPMKWASSYMASSNGVMTFFNGANQTQTVIPGDDYGKMLNYPAGTPSASLPGRTVGGGLFGVNSLAGWLGANGEFRTLSPYKQETITDPSWFDFYNHTLDGPNYWDHRDFDAVNVSWEQTFMDGNLGFEVTYDRQESAQDRVTSSNPDRQTIHIDTMANFLDGTPNPNRGRLFYAINGNGSNIGYTNRLKESARATAFYTLDFSKITGRDSWASRIFGRNNFTALYESRADEDDLRGATRQTYFMNQPVGSYVDSFRPFVDVRQNYAVQHFGPSFAGTKASSAAGAGGIGIKDQLIIQPSSVQLWDPVAPSAGGRGWYSESITTVNQSQTPLSQREWMSANLLENKIISQAIIWQGNWLNNTVVPLVGWRRDEAESKNYNARPDATGYRMVVSPDVYRLPDGPGRIVEGDTKTYGLVLHSPQFIRERIGGITISPHFSQSDNFRPEPGRQTYFGEAIANPSGETREYGVSIATADGKYRLRVNKYKTEGKNVSMASNLPTGWYMRNMVEWASQVAYRYATGNAGSQFGVASDGRPVSWRPDGPGDRDGKPANQWYTQAEKDAVMVEMDAVLADYFSKPLDPRIVETMKYTNYFTLHPPYGRNMTGQAGGLTTAVTGSTVSEGYEIEFSANPIRGLTLVANITKTSAQRTELAASFDELIAEMDRVTSGPAGRLRIFGTPNHDDPTHNPTFFPGRIQTVSSNQWWRGVYNGMKFDYDFFKALEGSDVAELRPWAGNLIASYAFEEGRLKGLTLGAAARYQDGNTLGYAVVPLNVPGRYTYDVNSRFIGEYETNYDCWASYAWKIGKISVNTQVNIRNVMAKDKLIPVTVQPDGSTASSRIAPPRTVYLSNTFRF